MDVSHWNGQVGRPSSRSNSVASSYTDITHRRPNSPISARASPTCAGPSELVTNSFADMETRAMKSLQPRNSRISKHYTKANELDVDELFGDGNNAKLGDGVVVEYLQPEPQTFSGKFVVLQLAVYNVV